MAPFRLSILALLLFCSTAFCGGTLKTPDGFLTVLREAYNAKNFDDISTLTWWQGVSKEDQAQQEQTWTWMSQRNPIISDDVFVPLDPDFKNSRIEFGKRVEVTYQPQGLVKMTFEAGGSVTVPYAIVDGAYYLVAARSTDLGWKGPDDKLLQLKVTGDDADTVKVHVEYNASGVAQQEDPVTPHNYIGQYFTRVTVTSDNPGANVTLELAEGDNPTPTYKSKPLVGKGTIVYQRPDKAGSH